MNYQMEPIAHFDTFGRMERESVTLKMAGIHCEFEADTDGFVLFVLSGYRNKALAVLEAQD